MQGDAAERKRQAAERETAEAAERKRQAPRRKVSKSNAGGEAVKRKAAEESEDKAPVAKPNSKTQRSEQVAAGQRKGPANCNPEDAETVSVPSSTKTTAVNHNRLAFLRNF